MRKLSIVFLFSCLTAIAAEAQSPVVMRFDKTAFSFALDPQGTPTYSLQYGGQPVVLPSALGFALVDQPALQSGFQILSVDSSNVDENWTPVLGQEKSIRNHYRQLGVKLFHPASGIFLNLCFRVFSEGLGFRYEFPLQPKLKYFVVANELTQFNLSGDHQTFWIPGDYDTNEYPYTKSPLSAINNQEMVKNSTDISVRVAPDPYSVQTPLMMKSKEGLYINIHEAALVNYPAMQLHVNTANFQLTSSLVPDAVGNKAYLHAPTTTPWRTIIVSDKAADILASRMILNLNEPSKLENTAWIKPMKFVGVWWEMQTGVGTWSYSDFPDSLGADGKLIPNGRHSGNNQNVKRYIDFAAANGIDAVLVEGWNTGWEDWFGNWKEAVFNFAKSYPDFDVQALHQYAAERKVALIMHNETSGSATDYERQLDTAYKFMQANGYPAVKTGYVGRIIPRGEHHDGQWMVNHYVRVAERAAAAGVTVDMHESVRPTGLNRTYPNWVANEAARGNEFYAFSPIGNPVNHETILPFTRLMGGPMDYTPGIFKLRNYTGDTKKVFHSTLCKQLALYVTMYSPLQMAADLPENYAGKMDAFQFIKDVPLDWDETRIVDAEPGEWLGIVRKEKGKANWYFGAITGEHSKQMTLNCDFLEKGKQYEATIYEDAKGTDAQTNPEAYLIRKIKINQKTQIPIQLPSGGGTAIAIKQL